MSEEATELKKYPEWVEGELYDIYERCTFRGQVYEAQHRTVVRPRLTDAWRLIESKP